MRSVIILSMLWICGLVCWGTVYPIEMFVEDNDVVSGLFIEINESPFTGVVPEDRMVIEFMTARLKNDIELYNSFFCPELQVEDPSMIRYLMGQKKGLLKGVVKYRYEGYLCYHTLTSEDLWPLYLKENSDMKFDNFSYPVFSALCERAVTPFLLKRTTSTNIQINSMSAIPLGEQNDSTLYFKYYDAKNPLTLQLEKTVSSLNMAYVKKDLDALSCLVSKPSLGRMLVGLTNGSIDPRFEEGPLRPIGVIDMDPVYVYFARKEDSDTAIFRRFLRKGDHYYLINYLGGGGPLEIFLSSKELRLFLISKSKLKEGEESQREAGSPSNSSSESD